MCQSYIHSNMCYLNGQGMHPRLKLYLQARVHQTVTSNGLHLGSHVWLEKCGQNILQDLVELWADNHHLEVRLASLGHIVHVGLVDDLVDREWAIMVHGFTSRCSGLNLSVSLVLMEVATLPSSPAMVNLCSSVGQEHTVCCSLACCLQRAKPTKPPQ